jgi:hypothetical protein
MAKEIYPQKEFSLGKRVLVDFAQPIETQFPHLSPEMLAQLHGYNLPEYIVSIPLPRESDREYSLFFRSEPCIDREIIQLPDPSSTMYYLYYNQDTTPRDAMDSILEKNSTFGLIYDNMLTNHMQAFSPSEVTNYLSMIKNFLVKNGIFALQLSDTNPDENVLVLEYASTTFGSPELCKLYQIGQDTTDIGAVWIFRNIDGANPFGLRDVSQENPLSHFDDILRRIPT